MSLFSPGDVVHLTDDVDKLKTLQEGHGGFHIFMLITCLGQKGVVNSLDDDGDINVLFSGSEWCINPKAVTKRNEKGNDVDMDNTKYISAKKHEATATTSGVTSCTIIKDDPNIMMKISEATENDTQNVFEGSMVCVLHNYPEAKAGHAVGDMVKLDATPDKLKVIQRGHGGWKVGMQKAIGKVGVIEEVHSNGDLKVRFSEGRWSLNPDACVAEKATSVKAKSSVAKRRSSQNIDKQSPSGRKGKETNAANSKLPEAGFQCIICMDKKVSIVFQCGHVTCDVCCEKIEICHLCKQPITNKINVYI